MAEMERHIICSDESIRSALEKINKLTACDGMTLFVINRESKTIGTLTDGDIRRGLLSGKSLADSVKKVMHSNFLYLGADADSMASIESARQRGVDLLPRLDGNGRLTSIVDLRKLRSVLPLDAVLMAGGLGMRLRPLTLTTPKPLLPVGGKPIIDYNVDNLRRYGIENIFATVNYKREMIEQHFAQEDNSEHAAVRCVREPAPLGTFGSLTLVEGLQHDDVVVMNADLFTEIDFEGMYRRHRDTNAELTIAAVPYTVSVPYAILSFDEEQGVKSIEEKPTYNYFANGGVYIIRRSLIAEMQPGGRLDAPDFIDMILSRGGRVSYFPIEGTWTDIGSPDDYRCVCERMAR